MFPPLVVAREQNRPAYLAAESTRVAKTDDLDHYSQDYHSFVSAAIVLRRIYSYILTFIPCEMPRMACLGAASSISASWGLLSLLVPAEFVSIQRVRERHLVYRPMQVLFLSHSCHLR